MNDLTVIAGPVLPAIIAESDDRARLPFLEFFAAEIRNPNTRRAYDGDVSVFLAWYSFRGTGLTAYLDNGCDLKRAQDMANHASISTTQLYDRRSDDVRISDVELVRI